MNKISYSSLKKTLTPKEMKDITGGSTYMCLCIMYGQESYEFMPSSTSCEEARSEAHYYGCSSQCYNASNGGYEWCSY